MFESTAVARAVTAVTAHTGPNSKDEFKWLERKKYGNARIACKHQQEIGISKLISEDNMVELGFR